MSGLSIPRFLDLAPVPPKPDGRRNLDRRIVEAIRYDYEIALLSMADVARKYRDVLHPDSARDIMNRATYPGVEPVYHHLGYCLKWRQK